MSVDENISLLERYVLAQDKEAFFATLLKNSTTYTTMRLVDSVNRHGLSVPESEAVKLKEFLSKPENKSTVLVFECRLMEIENEKDEKKRKELMSAFNKDYLHCYFQYTRPPNVRTAGNEDEAGAQKTAPKTHLNVDEWDLQKMIAAFMNENVPWNKISEFSDEALHYFDCGELLKKHPECYVYVLKNLENYSHIPAAKFVKTFKKFSEECDKHSPPPTDFFSRMTLGQLELLIKEAPEILTLSPVVGEFFRKKFHKDLRGIAQLEEYPTPEEHRDVLLKMHAWAKKLPSSPRNDAFASQIMREILQLDLRTNNIREDAFLEYLKNPLDSVDGVYARTQANVVKVEEWKRYHNFQSNQWDKERDLVTKYLRYLLKNAKNTKAFERYFETEFLHRMHCEARLHAGLDVPAAANTFSESELTALRESKQLEFAPWCKRQFQPGEPIDIALQVKNMNSVTVNVYVVDTASFYRRKMSPIENEIDLVGLIPTLTAEHTLNQPPIVQHILELKNIFEPKRGVYVVEFVGGGHSTRALIRVGALTLVRRPLSKGILFSVVDETQSVCHSSETAILLDGKEFKPEEKLNHGILIPYSSTQVQSKAIILHDGFAMLQEILVPREKVAFDFSLLLNEENTAKSGKVQLLLMPTLTICDHPMSLVALKKVVVDIVSTNYKQVQSSQTYENVELHTGRGIPVNYMIPPNTVEITVLMKAQLFSVAQGKNIDVTATEKVFIGRSENESPSPNLYLTQEGEEYRLNLLGKNGESYSKHRVSIQVTPRYHKETKPVELETDEEGIVHLSTVARCAESVEVRVVDGFGGSLPMPHTFKLLNTDAIDTLPSAMDAVEGEAIVLPALQDASRTDTVAQYTLVELCAQGWDSVVSDHASKIQSSNGTLVIKGLEYGMYALKYLGFGKSIRIRVLKGKRWECSPSEYVSQKGKIEKMGHQAHALACSPIQVTNGNAEFVVSSANLGTVEVHAFAYTFAPFMLEKMQTDLGKLRRETTPVTYKIATGSCAFLAEKQLGDEEQYVMTRKRRRAALGNTLEKPPGILKRHFVRDTTQSEENLRKEKVVGDAAYHMSPSQIPFGAANANAHCKRVARGNAGRMVGSQPVDTIPALQKFLVHNGWSQLCLTPDPTTGKVSFPVPVDQGFSTLLVVVRDSTNCITHSSSLPFSTRPLQSVCLSRSRQPNKVYADERIAHKLHSGNTCELPDGASYFLVDTVESAVKVLKLIRTDSGWDKWDFLSQWESLTAEERLKKYDEFMCHELNLFVYFKDPEFFNIVAKPHIQSKSTKQVIDHLLLGTESELAKYSSLVRLSELSVVERALFVHFMREKEPELCSTIVRDLQARASAVRDITAEFEKRFDSVLSGQQQSNDSQQPMPPMPPMAQAMVTGMMGQDGMGAGRSGRMNLMMASAPAPVSMRSRGFGGAANFACADSLEMAMDDMEEDEKIEVVRFKEPENTKEYVEKQFYASARAPHAEYCKYWADVAAHFASSDRAEPLLTQNFIYATTSVSESILAISVLGIPLKASEHECRSVSNTLQITAGSTCLAFTKVIADKGEQKLDLDILVAQRFYSAVDPYSIAMDGTKALKPVKEFLVGELYEFRVSITNSTESQHDVSVVTEVPQGSIPVYSPTFTETYFTTLEPLSTQIFKSSFYFPCEGEFTYFPTAVNKDGYLVGSATCSGTLKVVRSRTITTMETLSDVLKQGSSDDILEFMSKINLHNPDVFQFHSIYWLLNKPDFYVGVKKLLKNVAFYDPTVWSFSIVHGDYDTFVEYLRSQLETVSAQIEKLMFLRTRDFEVDRFTYKEYSPLVLARAHDVGEYKHNIRNNEFRRVYEEFLTYLFQKGSRLVSKDYLFLATYLFVQERLEDVEAVYPLINPQEIDGEMKIQYDYLTAYLDIYQGYPTFTKAREVSMGYATYPVFTWRNRFIDVLNLLAEFEGDVELQEKTEETSADKNKRFAKSEPYLACELQNAALNVTTRNISTLTVNYHKIDMELLFSKDPFMSTDNVDCSFVLPTASVKLSVAAEASTDKLTETKVDIPADLVGSNLIVHAISGSLTESATYLPSSMNVQVNKNFGLVKTLTEDTHKPIPKVYVKAFAKYHSGEVKFFKDGYTDLRGSFEYASVSGSSALDKIAELSILLCSPEHGAVIRRSPPPPTVATVNVKARALVSLHMQMAQNQMAQMAGNRYQF